MHTCLHNLAKSSLHHALPMCQQMKKKIKIKKLGNFFRFKPNSSFVTHATANTVEYNACVPVSLLMLLQIQYVCACIGPLVFTQIKIHICAVWVRVRTFPPKQIKLLRRGGKQESFALRYIVVNTLSWWFLTKPTHNKLCVLWKMSVRPTFEMINDRKEINVQNLTDKFDSVNIWRWYLVKMWGNICPFFETKRRFSVQKNSSSLKMKTWLIFPSPTFS